MAELRELEPLLIPRPRKLRLTGGWVDTREQAARGTAPGATLPAACSVDGALGPQELRIVISRDSATAPVLCNAVLGSELAIPRLRAIFQQLRRQYGDILPAMEIEDSPAFPTRGVMLDISRDRVPTMEHLFLLADILGTLSFSHLQLYTEHTFAYTGHEEVWGGWDPLTPAEVREFDVFCRMHGIELAANQNCFGHLGSWLRHPRYAPLAETHGPWEFEHAGERFERSGPFSLCPTDPRSLELVQEMLGQLLPCFTSKLVNIGCDETFDVGAGRSAAAVREQGRTAVCIEFTRRVCALAGAHGSRPMFWADMALHEPELTHRLGDGIALVWDYEPGYPWRERIGSLREQGLETWVCPGTSCWRSITGRTAERCANLRQAAAAGHAAGATGFLVTEWGDAGHHQQWPITLHALAEAADAAWTGGRDGYDARAAALHLFGDRTLSISALLDELGDTDAMIRRVAGRAGPDGSERVLRNASALFVDLHTPLREVAGDPRVRQGLARAGVPLWEQTLERLEYVREHARIPDPLMQEELRHTLDLAGFAADRALLRRGAKRSRRAELLVEAERLRAEHAGLWLRRSRPGGLSTSLTHYDRLVEDLQGASP